MKKFLITAAVFILLGSFSFGQQNFNSFISYVGSISDSLQKNAVLDSFITYHRTIRVPIIEDSIAIFLYKGNVNSVSLAGDFNGWSANISLIKLPRSNFYYFTKSFENNARLDYKFVLNGSSWILDPYNPNQVSGGFGPNSEIAMPGYIQPWEIKYNASIPQGTLITRSITSVNTNSTFQLQIFFPSEYNTNPSKRYPTVYFQDGSEYVSLGSAVNVINNLIAANKIEPVVAIFVKPNNRNDEYAGNLRVKYQAFFANELVPMIDSSYRTIDSASKRVVLGDSYGGNISALISYNYSNVFGLCGLHSAAFQANNNEAYNLIVNGTKKNIRYASVWGTYEGLSATLRPFRDNLISKGYDYKWLELPEGHSWGLWRANIDFVLEYFFPSPTLQVKDSKSENIKLFELFQNFPNPFNPRTVINYSIAARSHVSIKVYDVVGNEVAILINEEKQAGSHSIEFVIGDNKLSSGIYFYRIAIHSDRIKAGNYIETKKMVFLK